MQPQHGTVSQARRMSPSNPAEVTGYWHSRETFGTVDGPGIRYVLFLSGCSLGCRFCHNPDTWAHGEKAITAGEVLREVEEYRQFYQPDGGITISGGEPLLQPDFVAAVFSLCQEKGLHTAIDTSGAAPRENLLRVLPHLDHVLFSLKGATPASYRELTCGDFVPIRENLRLLASRKHLTVRYVLIPGMTDDALNRQALITLMCELPPQVDIEVLPYHTMGVPKWHDLGWDYTLADIPAATAGQTAAFCERLQESLPARHIWH